MTEQSTQTNIPTIRMSVDIKKDILSILSNSDGQFTHAMAPGTNTPYSYLRSMDANNNSIRAILNAIE